jgi:hypothetical protein
MNMLQREKRHSRARQPQVESLDLRIVPAAGHPAVVGAADLASANLGVDSQAREHESAHAETALRREQRMIRLAERHERVLERRELRAERLAALYKARHQIVLAFPAQNQVVSPATSADSSPVMPAAASSAGGAGNTAVLSGSAPSSAPSSTPASATVQSNIAGLTSSGSSSSGSTDPTASSLPPNVSVQLATVYEEFENGDLTSSTAPGQVEIQGTNVGVDIHAGNATDFNTMVAALESLGLEVTASSNTDDVVEGYLPIAQLPAAAAVAGSPAIGPILNPNSFSGVLAM